MSFDKQSDVKNHLFRRTRSQIHLIPSASQPDATGFSGVEKVDPPTSPDAAPVENALEHVPKEYEALRDFLVSESTDTSNGVQQ